MQLQYHFSLFFCILQDLMTILNLIFKINQEAIVLLASASLRLAGFNRNYKSFSACCSEPQALALDKTYYTIYLSCVDTELLLLKNHHPSKEHLTFNSFCSVHAVRSMCSLDCLTVLSSELSAVILNTTASN